MTLRDHPKRVTCRFCGALVVWLDTPHGSAIPVDPEPVAGGHVAVVDGKAVAVKSGLFEPIPTDPARYYDHGETCPEADRWRRKK